MNELEINNTGSGEGDIHTRSNGSQVFSETYSEAAIDRLKLLVHNFYSKGEQKFFSISVDGETVVQKTSDPAKFDDYLRFISPYTKLIEVRLYQGVSPNCNKYQFFQNRSLSGLESKESVQARIDRALESQALRHQVELLSKQVQELELELNSKKKKVKKLKKLTVNQESGADKLTGFLTKGTQVLGALGLIKNNQLAGVPEIPSEVTIEPHNPPVSEHQNSSVAQSEADLTQQQQLFKSMVDAYGEDGIKNAMQWLCAMSEYPEIQEKIKQELQNKQNGKA